MNRIGYFNLLLLLLSYIVQCINYSSLISVNFMSIDVREVQCFERSNNTTLTIEMKCLFFPVYILIHRYELIYS